MNIYGKGNDVMSEEEAAAMIPLLQIFHTFLDDKFIHPKCLYNEDKTILY